MATWPANSETDWNTKMLAYLAVSLNTDGTPKTSVFGFGAWQTKDSGDSDVLAKDEVYKVGSDGFVVLYNVASAASFVCRVYTDSNNPPTTLRVSGYSANTFQGGVTCPVRKDDYWKVTGNTATIFWMPIGSGTCVKQ